MEKRLKQHKSFLLQMSLCYCFSHSLWVMSGKTDQSAAGAAYDALVNQLLTLMDGLTEAYNTLVVGLTNRRELLDTALLRPGR